MRHIKLLHYAFAGLFIAAFFVPQLWGIIYDSVRDSWYQAGAFVFFTLALIYGVEKIFAFDLASWLRPGRRGALFVAAMLGSFPGCGGAIVVVLSFMRGQVTLGALVAALTTTMGDAAFLLLGRAPLTALGIIAIQYVAGISMGFVVDMIHGASKTKVIEATDYQTPAKLDAASGAGALAAPLAVRLVSVGLLGWAGFSLFTFVVAVLLASVTIASSYALELTGFAGGLLMVLWWLRDPSEDITLEHEANASKPWASLALRIFNETAFVTGWVTVAYLVFSSITVLSGIELEPLLREASVFLPLIAIMIGFIPGCGPQIIVTTLFLDGLIPFSAMLGNAISSDGDAFLPAMKLSPKAITIATLYSAFPGLVIAYLWFWLLE